MFNKTEEYANLVDPKVQELKKACFDNQIPFFITMALEDDEKKTVYKTESCSGVSAGYTLTDDKFVDHLKVTAGFKAKPEFDERPFKKEIQTEMLEDFEIMEALGDD